MIRYLSELWVSHSIDRHGSPARLWCMTFGRLSSHRWFASQLRQLDGQLTRQAISQQRAIAREQWPIGVYPARSVAGIHTPVVSASGRMPKWVSYLMRPSLVAVVCGVFVACLWLAWPTPQEPSFVEFRATTTRSFNRVWEPLSGQAQATSQALREQTTYVTSLPDRVPAMDQVVNKVGTKVGTAIEEPIREEMRRFARDMTRPWINWASQLPRPLPGQGTAPVPAQG